MLLIVKVWGGVIMLFKEFVDIILFCKFFGMLLFFGENVLILILLGIVMEINFLFGFVLILEWDLLLFFGIVIFCGIFIFRERLLLILVFGKLNKNGVFVVNLFVIFVILLIWNEFCDCGLFWLVGVKNIYY